MSFGYSRAQQQESNPYILFTGLVLTSDSLKPLPYVSIKNNRRGLIGYTNEYGHFDVVVKKGDTIWFTQVEKVSSWHIIPDTLTRSRYHVVTLMAQDTLDLPAIFIRALPLKTLFDHDFVTADVPDDAYERARKNLEAEALKDEIKLKPADSKQSQQLLAKTRADQLYYYKQAPPQNYLSPYVWAQFLQAWKRGDFKKKPAKKK
ncbi:MAG: carboxypeptidase-like regulatory domain-containing protein [Bacteroidia bacterium]|nr:carboxypeptidase-like regulatory domain-containing protein [Bacteroidia bacterium]